MRVNGRRFCDHKRHHLNTGALQALIDAGKFKGYADGEVYRQLRKDTDCPQAKCPLCLGPPRPRHGNTGKFKQFKIHSEKTSSAKTRKTFDSRDKINPNAAKEEQNAALEDVQDRDAFDESTTREDRDAAMSVRIGTPATGHDHPFSTGSGLSWGDLQSMKFDTLPEPRRHDRTAPFRNIKELRWWLLEQVNNDTKENRTLEEQPKLFHRLGLWAIVGEFYFVRGLEARDIYSMHMQDFASENAVEMVIKRMRAKFKTTSDGTQ